MSKPLVHWMSPTAIGTLDLQGEDLSAVLPCGAMWADNVLASPSFEHVTCEGCRQQMSADERGAA